MIIQTVKECEERLLLEIQDAIENGGPMELFCSEFYSVKNSLETMKFSEEDVWQFMRLEPSQDLKSKVRTVFGEKSPITKSFNNVTSGVFPYAKVIEQSYGAEVLSKLQDNLKNYKLADLQHITELCEEVLEKDLKNQVAESKKQIH